MIRLGVICPSDIAFRRFIPSLKKADGFDYVGVSIATPKEWFGDKLNALSQEIVEDTISSETKKAMRFVDTYGGRIFNGYESMILSNDVDAIYIPLPPALHYEWAAKALRNGKHVFVEKPSTTCLDNTKELIRLAKVKSLALHENYMFVFHDQIDAINKIIQSGVLGEVRNYRITFGFPLLDLNNFRYNKRLGGGALLDAGGYTLKYASILLGLNSHLVAATSNFLSGFDVDMFGSATMINDDGIVAQLAYGMDNDYRCDLEVWCSRGTLTSNRVLTAPSSFEPSCTIKINQEYKIVKLPVDDAFLKSIRHFGKCVNEDIIRENNYRLIEFQENLIESFKELCSKH